LSVALALPQAPAIFYGREEYVRTIVSTIVSGHASGTPVRIVVLGSGGMGKTSVALAVMNHGDIRLLFPQHGHGILCDRTPSIALLLEALAHSFHVTEKTSDRLGYILTSLRSLLSSRLIILDNPETI
jgi:hypothetical protein